MRDPDRQDRPSAAGELLVRITRRAYASGRIGWAGRCRDDFAPGCRWTLCCGSESPRYMADPEHFRFIHMQEALRMEPQLAEVFAGWADGYEYSEAEAAFRPFLYIELLEDYLSADVALAAVRRLEELGWSQS